MPQTTTCLRVLIHNQFCVIPSPERRGYKSSRWDCSTGATRTCAVISAPRKLSTDCVSCRTSAVIFVMFGFFFPSSLSYLVPPLRCFNPSSLQRQGALSPRLEKASSPEVTGTATLKWPLGWWGGGWTHTLKDTNTHTHTHTHGYRTEKGSHTAVCHPNSSLVLSNDMQLNRHGYSDDRREMKLFFFLYTPNPVGSWEISAAWWMQSCLVTRMLYLWCDFLLKNFLDFVQFL